MVSGHATNQELLIYLRHSYPNLSKTTIHRITKRMLVRQDVILAPPARDNSLRFDINTMPHDHFHCLNCDRLKDLLLTDSILAEIQTLAGDCKISGRLTIQGSCKQCLKYKEEL